MASRSEEEELPRNKFRSSQEDSNSASDSNENEPVAEKRDGFGNRFEFVLTCLGLAVGLGNIWRFPTRAYENGGSAFLIPYIVCGIFFGLPALYFEFLVGQYQGKAPPIAFRRVMPVVEGVGWMGVVSISLVSVYYMVLISWISIYLVNIFRGDFEVWNKCDNAWNVEGTCIDMLQQKLCHGPNPLGWNGTQLPVQMFYIGGKCQDAALFSNVTLISATEQYFMNHVVRPSSGLFDFGGINWPVLATMTVLWIMTGLGIVKGMKIIGKISYVAVLLPYIIIVILFIRGVTLEGASTGLYYYFGKPDYGKLLTIKTWIEALKQLCFSIAVGYSGLMTLASYGRRQNNVFRDALIVIIGDTMMSLVGGAAVFSTLGFLALQRGVTVPEVVQSGLSLAFVVYPEAMTQMPLPWLWSFLFFFMLFLLGASTEIVTVNTFCSCLYDQNKSLAKKKCPVVLIWCSFLFELFDEYSAGFSAVCCVFFELVVIMYVYGYRRFRDDITEVFEEPRNALTKAIGPHSSYFIFNWMVISPIIAVLLVVLSSIRDYPYQGKPDVYPPFFDIFGWFLSFLPVLMIPLFIGINYYRCCRQGLSLSTLFMLQKQHASYERISQEFSEEKMALQSLLPDKEPWDEEEGDSTR